MVNAKECEKYLENFKSKNILNPKDFHKNKN